MDDGSDSQTSQSQSSFHETSTDDIDSSPTPDDASDNSVLSSDSDTSNTMPNTSIPNFLQTIRHLTFANIFALLCIIAVNIHVFVIDRRTRLNNHCKTLYKSFGNTISIRHVTYNHIRRCVHFLREHTLMLRWWVKAAVTLRDTFDVWRKCVWLSPPTNVCPECSRRLVGNNIRVCHGISGNGVVNVFEESYRCCNKNCLIVGRSITHNYHINEHKKKRFWNNQTKGKYRSKIFSKELNKYENIICILLFSKKSEHIARDIF